MTNEKQTEIRRFMSSNWMLESDIDNCTHILDRIARAKHSAMQLLWKEMNTTTEAGRKYRHLGEFKRQVVIPELTKKLIWTLYRYGYAENN
jgi:hypothetical protein